jgi:hypothetical protein
MRFLLKISLAAFCAVFISTSFAQEGEGKIVGTQTMTSDDAAMQQQLAMMGDMTMTTYYKGDMVRVEQSGAMTGSNITIFNSAEKKGVMMMDNPFLGKKYVKLDEPISDESEEDDTPEIEVTRTKETMKIAGHKCYKYILTVPGEEQNVIMWVAEDLEYKGKDNYDGKIKGMPMRTETKTSQMGATVTVVYEVTEISDSKVSDDLFDMTKPEGFEEVSLEDLQGGFGG